MAGEDPQSEKSMDASSDKPASDETVHHPEPLSEAHLEKPEDEEGHPEGHPEGLSFILLTAGLMAVVLVVALDNYIISKIQHSDMVVVEGRRLTCEATAVPTITTHFSNLNLVGWYGSSYFLTLMSFQAAFGQLCTLFPVKKVYLASIIGFEVGSTLSAAAPNAEAFIVGRLISGAAGGGLWCGTLTLMAHAVPVRKRHLYVSVVTSMYGVASAAGPLLGGIFTDSPSLTWRFCFWINLRTSHFVLPQFSDTNDDQLSVSFPLSLLQRIVGHQSHRRLLYHHPHKVNLQGLTYQVLCSFWRLL